MLLPFQSPLHNDILPRHTAYTYTYTYSTEVYARRPAPGSWRIGVRYCDLRPRGGTFKRYLKAAVGHTRPVPPGAPEFVLHSQYRFEYNFYTGV